MRARKEIVTSLISSIVPEEDQTSYRINIYIALTLSLLKEGWIGTEQQRKAIEDLRGTSSYKKDSTFRGRVDDALKSYILE